MKFAIVDGRRHEALPGLLGRCQECGAIMASKCGRFRVAHWAHPPGSVHRWWKPETKWHRDWKECFPREWQERVHPASNGERHIADVKTVHGQVIEFQRSDISEEERRSREEFYCPMCWVVDGLRLKWDQRQFLEALRCREAIRVRGLIAVPVDKCTLLRKWANSRVLVFVDFGGPILWASLPEKPNGYAVLTPVPRDGFLEGMIGGRSIKGSALSVPQVTPPPRPGSFEHYLARKDRARARRRI